MVSEPSKFVSGRAPEARVAMPSASASEMGDERMLIGGVAVLRLSPTANGDDLRYIVEDGPPRLGVIGETDLLR